MAGARAANIALDRKALSELAIHDNAAFVKIVEKAKGRPPRPGESRGEGVSLLRV